MLPMTLAEIAATVGGRIDGDPAVLVTGPAYLDSRRPVDGGLFVALTGARVDGHDHASAAHAVLGTRPTGRPAVLVTDAVVALGRLARHVVATVRPRVAVVTGSHGKTTTKDLLAGLLPGAVATEGNLNNELGVPLTCLRLHRGDRDLVLEAGARGVGHLSYLADLARPHIACVTGLGSAHLGAFGSAALLAEAKGELVEALPAGGVAVLPAEEPRAAAMAARTQADVLTFGRDRGEVSAGEVTLDDLARPAFLLRHDGRTAPVRLALVGVHAVHSALAAAACALAAGQALEDVAHRLTDARPGAAHRLQPRRRADGLLVLDDTYNANPEAALVALQALAHVARQRGGRAVAVLGPMHELGPSSAAAHAAVGRAARSLGVAVLGVGAGADGYGGEWVADQDGATARLQHVGSTDTVLVKASRSVRLDLLVEELLRDAG
ncbi:UDP-N-acetylmuramoyl-tripeptide--D-alanyl-D-alanine ligase [uncultured Modestobacter sp.]|uniref:UDP-N-acetylmuramoyl-tripeptide--D-alanyl-D- alanine ligase n=1 Tax=uncultured Modestobacter sp. TaxID=380048 RepID=UPI00263665EB|nr:UDP-N-acetylmuramoyl-tripeptide--D-alanyl-D-alanine ligase [uncultured Modestobacter sp.]